MTIDAEVFVHLFSGQVYPQSLRHDPKGRVAVVCGDGEYIIYTVSMSLCRVVSAVSIALFWR